MPRAQAGHPPHGRAGRLLLPALLTALCGCTDMVRVSSEPSGARLLVNGRERGVTPRTVMVNRTSQRITVELHRPDCRPLAELLRREADGRPVPWQHFRLEPVGAEAAPSEGGTIPAARAGGGAAKAPAVSGHASPGSERP